MIDADAATGIAPFDLKHLTEDERRALTLQGPALPYAVRPGAKTLIIGPGGGWDVARALVQRQHRCHRRGDQRHHRQHHHARALRPT